MYQNFSPFYGQITFHCKDMLHFVYSSVDEHLGWFHFLALRNNAAMNVVYRFGVGICFYFFGICLRVEGLCFVLFWVKWEATARFWTYPRITLAALLRKDCGVNKREPSQKTVNVDLGEE